MEQRHTLRSASLSAALAGWSLRQVLPWICLLVVVSTSTYGFLLATASMGPAPAVDQVDGNYAALSGHDAWMQRGAFLQAPMSSTRTVLITGHDAATGERVQLECVTTTDRYPEDALLVHLTELREVAAQLCNGANAPAVRP
jgi:hypothetical protein